MTTWFPTEDPVPAVETWAEARYTQISGGEKIPFITVVALISLAFGVSGPGELLLGSGGMLAHYYAGGGTGSMGLSAFCLESSWPRKSMPQWRSQPFWNLTSCLRTSGQGKS